MPERIKRKEIIIINSKVKFTITQRAIINCSQIAQVSLWDKLLICTKYCTKYIKLGLNKQKLLI